MRVPKNDQEYRQRFNENQRIEGFGIETTTVLPCPFCAAADWLRLPITRVEPEMSKSTMCKECGRSAKAIFTKTEASTSFEIVQTGGPEQPEWLYPKLRRVDV